MKIVFAPIVRQFPWLVVLLASASALATPSFELCRDAFPVSGFETRLQHTIQSLARLRIRVDQSRNRFTPESRNKFLDREVIVKEAELYEVARLHGRSESVIREALRREILKLVSTDSGKLGDGVSDQERADREKQRAEFESLGGTQIALGLIQPGSVKLPGDYTLKTVFKVESPFFLQRTPVTQSIWTAVVLKAKELFPTEYHLLKSKPFAFTGNLRPAENISYNMIEEWLSALNRIRTLDKDFVRELMPQVPADVELRLPTVDEWEYAGAAATQNAMRTDGDQFKLETYGWLSKNSKYVTHDVNLRRSMVIDGIGYSDLVGNVRILTSTRYEGHLSGPRLNRGLDHKSFFTRHYWFEDTYVVYDNYTDPRIGFRLAASLKAP